MVAQFNERTNLILEYQKSFQRLKGVQHYVQEHKEELSKSVSPEFKTDIDSILEADQFVVPPLLASSVNLGEVVASADYIGDKLNTVQSILSSTIPTSTSRVIIKDTAADETYSKGYLVVDIRTDLEKKEKEEPTAEVGEFTKEREKIVMEGLKSAEEGIKSAKEVAKNGVNEMTESEKYALVSRYYDALTEMQITSTDMDNLVKELEQDEKLRGEAQGMGRIQQAATTVSIKENKGFWQKIRDKIERGYNFVTKTIPGWVNEKATAAYKFMTSLPEKVKEGLEGVMDFLHELARKFKDLLVNIVREMFKFITTLRDIAKQSGYGLTKIDVEIPSIKMGSVGFFGLSIPIPVIEGPKITLSITSNSAGSG